eukprot:gene7514-10236_t
MVLYLTIRLFLSLLILFQLLYGFYPSDENYQKSNIWHKEGLNYANQGNYRLALSYFRGAVRLNNQSVVLWNDLGVTEMRVALHSKALKRFHHALNIIKNIDSTNLFVNEIQQNENKRFNIKLLYDNIDLLEDFIDLSVESIDNNMPQLHHLLEIPELILSDSHNSNELLKLQNIPFIIHYGFNNQYNENNDLMSKLSDLYPNYKVDFYPHNMVEEQVHPLFISLKQSILQLTSPQETYLDIDASLPESGAGMFNHKDTLRTSSYQLQLKGRKKWHLCDPTQNEFLYKAGEIDLFHPNYRKYPKAINATCYQFIAYPGDIIYYPADYWHQTLNLDTPTISIGSSIIIRQNFRKVQYELEKECKGKKRIFIPDNTICTLLNQCYKLWKNIFMNKFNETEFELQYNNNNFNENDEF